MGHPVKISCLLFSTLFVVCSFFYLPFAGAQIKPYWEDLKLYGGQINSIAADPREADRLYAGSWGGDGLFRSTNAGATWSAVPSATAPQFKNMVVYDIAPDPNNPDTIWVADNDYINVSRDGGRTWQSIDFAARQQRFCFTLSVDSHDDAGNTVYVGTGGPAYTDQWGAVFKTTDSGISWNQTGLLARYDVVDLQLSLHQPGQVWAVSNPYQISPYGQICMSADAGITWTAWDFDWYIDELVVHPENQGLIFACGERGVIRRNGDWHQLEPSDFCSALCLSPAEPCTLYAGLTDAVARSTDCGLSWTYSEAPGTFLCLTPNAYGALTLYAGHENRGIFRSTDTAASWQQCNTGIRANAIFALDISPTDNTTILTGTLAGVYKSTDNASWQLINAAPAEAVAFHPVNADTMYAGLDWVIAKSSDNGKTWLNVPISDEPDVHGVSSISISSMAPDRVYAGIFFYSGFKGYVLASTDAGDHYHAVLQTTSPVNCIVAHPGRPEIIYAGTGNFFAPAIAGTVYKSTDSGSTWARLPLAGVVVNSLAVSPDDPDVIYAACGAHDGSMSGIFLSSDGGSTWHASVRGLPREADTLSVSAAVTSIVIDRQNSNQLAASLFELGVYMSLDAGTYWFGIGPVDDQTYTVAMRSPVNKRASASRKLPCISSPSIIAGTSSGAYQYSTAGSGLLTGMVFSSATDMPIDNAGITATCGGNCQSSSGYYMLLLPAGNHTITAGASGYQTSTRPGLVIQPGRTTTCDIELRPYSSDSICFIERLLQGSRHASSLRRLRFFRDHVLQNVYRGNDLIRLYYRASDLFCSLLTQTHRLKQHF